MRRRYTDKSTMNKDRTAYKSKDKFTEMMSDKNTDIHKDMTADKNKDKSTEKMSDKSTHTSATHNEK
jgi:hypothetical protein